MLGAGEAGGYNAPGLPNITGRASNQSDMGYGLYGLKYADGAFFCIKSKAHTPTGGNAASMSLGLDASLASPVYGNSTTVMPPSVNMPVVFYLGRPK